MEETLEELGSPSELLNILKSSEKLKECEGILLGDGGRETRWGKEKRD